MTKKYGVPHHCPNCTERDFFGMLKLPHEKLKPCPNCHTKLLPHHQPMTLSTPENKSKTIDSGE
jgi:hypothetical protein